MKSVLFLPSILVVALIFSGRSTARPSQSQSQRFEDATVSVAEEEYESGKLEESKENLKAVLQADPKNQAAQCYLHLVEQAQVTRLARANEPRQPQGWHQTIPQQPIF
jgi:Tfp pilus assembly protein PilF